MTKSPRPAERWLTAQETADRLRVKRKTLYNWATVWDVEHRGPEPHRMGGRSLRYREREVDQYIESQPRAA
ncbi:helix-turn-helix transcriptional regulator [Streptomyces sp. NPDC058256]|uniref:helix-turn-helix transcriptional regulator n=1 Tax=Streptomyces sp. NPDC058256 TaxID=3346408 RepID=UPI0036EE3B99